jgi:hypothetical protein
MKVSIWKSQYYLNNLVMTHEKAKSIVQATISILLDRTTFEVSSFQYFHCCDTQQKRQIRVDLRISNLWKMNKLPDDFKTYLIPWKQILILDWFAEFYINVHWFELYFYIITQAYEPVFTGSGRGGPPVYLPDEGEQVTSFRNEQYYSSIDPSADVSSKTEIFLNRFFRWCWFKNSTIFQ